MSLLQDPFYVVKEEVQQSVSGVTTLYERWQELLKSVGQGANTAQIDEFKWTATQIRNGIKSIEWDLQDLEETIGIVEGNRQRFKLDISEVESRKNFITETKTAIKRMKDELNSAQSKGKMDNDNRSSLMGGKPKGPAGKFDLLHAAIQDDNENFINGSQRQLQATMDQQDEDLTHIGAAVNTLKDMGKTINEELSVQSRMLDTMDDEVNKTQGRLTNTLRRLNKLLESTSDRVQWCLVIVLTLILIGLVVVVFYV